MMWLRVQGRGLRGEKEFLPCEDRKHADDCLLVLLNQAGGRVIEILEADRTTVVERWVWGGDDWEHLIKQGKPVTL